jgi:hypothetical protein
MHRLPDLGSEQKDELSNEYPHELGTRDMPEGSKLTLRVMRFF